MKHQLQTVAMVWVTLILTTIGCGQKAPPKVETVAGSMQQNSGSSAVGSGSCSASNCPPATMDVSVQGKTDTGLLVGVANEAVPWSFTGVAQESGRDVAILLNKIPPGAQINPPQDGSAANTSVSITWTPTAAATSTDKVQIYARDLTRCKATESDPKHCAANKILKDYDVKIAEAGWEIVSPDAVQGGGAAPGTASGGADGVTVKVSDPNCGGVHATTDQQIQGTLLQTGLKVLTGGGIMAILPGLIGAASNKTTAPTAC